jgi:curved DNA-binding protein CbpA
VNQLAGLLGVRLPVPEAELRQAYRRAAFTHHPDKGGDPEMMQAVNLAYERLKYLGDDLVIRASP